MCQRAPGPGPCLVDVVHLLRRPARGGGGQEPRREGPGRYIMSKQSGGRMRRVCTGTPVHYEQTVREEDAAGVYGYTGAL
jgi:hypothetical protein